MGNVINDRMFDSKIAKKKNGRKHEKLNVQKERLECLITI